MTNISTKTLFVLLLLCGLCSAASAQNKVFDWLPANDESVRLDPGNYHTARTYRPGPQGGNIHVEIRSQQPVTLFLTPEEAWEHALQNPETIPNLRQVCPKEHVQEIVYLCDLPPGPLTLVLFDERNNPDAALFAGLGAVLDSNKKTDRAVGTGIATVLTGNTAVTRHFKSPNDVHIQYFRWDCVQNCIQPEFQWQRQFKEKYEVTPQPKIYGGYAPGRDGEKVNVRIKSPVPMAVALVPAQSANQLYSKPQMLDAVLEKNTCQQRGVQSLNFDCTFNLADGPQSLVVIPEASSHIPRKKKIEIEMQAVKCIANCDLLPSKQ